MDLYINIHTCSHMAFSTNLWNDVHQIYHLGYLFKKNKIKETKLKRGGKVNIFSLSGQLISLSSFWLESKLAIGPSPQSSSVYADGLPEAYCCSYSGRTPALCVSFLPMNSARVRHWQSTWDTKQRTNASYHIGEPPNIYIYAF